MRPLNLKTCNIIPGMNYGTPKEIWGFRARAMSGSPLEVAREFLRANEKLLGLADIKLRVQKVIESLGAHHVIFQQNHLMLPVHRAYVTIHINKIGEPYLAKNRAVPADILKTGAEFRINKADACRLALRSVAATLKQAKVLKTDRLWFWAKQHLRPAFMFRIHVQQPRSEWIVYVDGATGKIISKYDNLAMLTGKASVFDPNPVIAMRNWRVLLRDGQPLSPQPKAYKKVVLRDLKGNGFLDGRLVSTRLTAGRVKRPDHQYFFKSSARGFEEAMIYFHIDRAIRYVESLGYRGGRAIFSEPLAVNARGTREDNSWYSPGHRSLTFGTGGVNDAEDAETILHEFGHALQDAICSDFGQSLEAAAIGEGFGDYFAASFFAAKKPPKYRMMICMWDSIACDRVPPCLRRLDDRRTYESFDHSQDADEHDNGKIWSATLWEIWHAVGREAADQIIIESHFQLDGFTTFAKGARAILDADRNLYGGRHVHRLRRIFQGRGIGPVE